MSDQTTVVEEIIRRNFPAARNLRELGRDLHLKEDLRGNDLDIIQAVMDLEDRFEIEITDDEDEALATVGDVLDLVAAKVSVPA